MKENRNKRIIYSLILNILVLLISVLVFKPFFEEIDDTHISMIAEGAYGYKEWHLIYTNVLLGKLYVFLSTIIPGIRWHVVIQYVFIFWAYVLFTYIFSNSKKNCVITTLAVLSTFYELYVSIQYTKTAAFMCVIGFLIILYLVRNNTGGKEAALLLIAANLFAIYGSLLRKESFFIAGVPVLFLGVYELIKTKKLKNYLVSFVPLFSVVFICMAIDSSVYSGDETWNSFMEYNSARMQLTDYRYDLLDYPTHGEELEKLGISENDAFMILTYQFGDDNVFTTDSMKKITDYFGRKPVNDYVFRTWYGNVRDEFSRKDISLYMLCFFVIFLFVDCIRAYKNSDKLRLASVILIGVSCSLALFYFHYSGRWSHRLVGSLVVTAIFVISYMINTDVINTEAIIPANNNQVIRYALSILCILSIGMNLYHLVGNRNAFNEWKESQTEVSDILISVEYEALNDADSPLYVADTFMFQDVWKYDVFIPSKQGELKNFITCGTWFINSPITKNVTEAYGYSNPFDALVSGGEDVVLLDKNMRDYKAEFVLEHYGIELNK